MNKKAIEKELRFLVERYGLFYFQENFETYMFSGSVMIMETHSFYNKHGCFTIAHLHQSSDVYFLYFNKIGAVGDWVHSDYDKQRKAEVDIVSVEPEIWSRHERGFFFKRPFFWWYGKRFIKALAEVIEHQIETTRQFFGIEVMK